MKAGLKKETMCEPLDFSDRPTGRMPSRAAPSITDSLTIAHGHANQLFWSRDLQIEGLVSMPSADSEQETI